MTPCPLAHRGRRSGAGVAPLGTWWPLGGGPSARTTCPSHATRASRGRTDRRQALQLRHPRDLAEGCRGALERGLAGRAKCRIARRPSVAGPLEPRLSCSDQVTIVDVHCYSVGTRARTLRGSWSHNRRTGCALRKYVTAGLRRVRWPLGRSEGSRHRHVGRAGPRPMVGSCLGPGCVPQCGQCSCSRGPPRYAGGRRRWNRRRTVAGRGRTRVGLQSRSWRKSGIHHHGGCVRWGRNDLTRWCGCRSPLDYAVQGREQGSAEQACRAIQGPPISRAMAREGVPWPTIVPPEGPACEWALSKGPDGKPRLREQFTRVAWGSEVQGPNSCFGEDPCLERDSPLPVRRWPIVHQGFDMRLNPSRRPGGQVGARCGPERLSKKVPGNNGFTPRSRPNRRAQEAEAAAQPNGQRRPSIQGVAVALRRGRMERGVAPGRGATGWASDWRWQRRRRGPRQVLPNYSCCLGHVESDVGGQPCLQSRRGGPGWAMDDNPGRLRDVDADSFAGTGEGHATTSGHCQASPVSWADALVKGEQAIASVFSEGSLVVSCVGEIRRANCRLRNRSGAHAHLNRIRMTIPMPESDNGAQVSVAEFGRALNIPGSRPRPCPCAEHLRSSPVRHRKPCAIRGRPRRDPSECVA